MKKILKFLLLFSAAAALMTGTAFADDGDVSFSVELAGNGVNVTGITVSGDTPVDVTVPEKLSYQGTNYNVVGVELQNMSKKDAENIKTLTFENDDVTIYGNLFKWQYEINGITDLTTSLGTISSTNYGIKVPDTDTFISNLPGFVSASYNYDSNNDGTNDTYYVGKNLVRVDTNYSGKLTIKEGTVSILAGAMEGCNGLGEVILPDSVEWIGVRAFANSGVTSVNIPEGLLTDGSKAIQMSTFYGCEKLTSVTFPEGVSKLSEIRHTAFYGCKSLTVFDFKRVTQIDMLSFAKAFVSGTEIDLSQTILDKNAPAVFSHSGVGSVTFGSIFNGENSENIQCEMFRNCTSLKTVDFGDAKVIGSWAFEDCTSLTGDVLASSKVQKLLYRAFANTGIIEITIPETMTDISGGAFAGNEQLETVNWKSSQSNNTMFSAFNDYSKGSYYWDSYRMPSGDKPSEYTFPKTVNIYALPSSSSYYGMFCDQPYLETVNFKCEIENIQNYMFQFCPNLKEITFDHPEKVKTIGSNAFNGCLSLNSFPFDKMTSLESIGQNAFLLSNYNSPYNQSSYAALTDAQKTYGLNEVDLSACEKLTSIEWAAFYNQYNVKKIHLPASVSLNGSAFNGTASLKEVICEGDADDNLFSYNMYSSISASSYGYNETVEKVTIKGQLTQKNSYANSMFYMMLNLKEVYLPNAESIPEICFQDCTGLETVQAPKALTVGKNAFFRSSISSELDLSNAASIAESCFQECKAIKVLKAPKLTTVGDYAFFKSGISSVAVNKDVSYGKYVFTGCNNLETVVVEEGVTALSDFMFTDCTALKQVSLPSTLQTINWAAFKNAPIEMVNIPASVTKIEDDAFSGGSKSIIMRGAPVIELVHGSDAVIFNDPLMPMDDGSVIYYVDDTSKTGAELYKASIGDKASNIEIKEIPATVNVDITGAPTSVKAGSALNLSNFKIICAGKELDDTQYVLDYDANDKTTGNRVVTVTVSCADVPEGVIETAVSASGVTGAAVSGKVYSLSDDSDEATGSFIVNVFKKSSSGSGTSTVPENKVDNNDSKVAFTDVSESDYYYDSVKWAVENGITQGTSSTLFSPDDSCTRAQAVTFLWRAAGSPAPENSEISFEDVDADAYYADAVMWAVEKRITKGVNSGSFAPDAECTRAQIVTFMMRAAGVSQASGTVDFTDVDSDAYYADAVLWAVENGITQGTSSSTFSPDAECTRAQIVTFLYRAYAAK